MGKQKGGETVQKYSGMFRPCSRYGLGMRPVIFLNTWEKREKEAKPACSPASEMLAEGPAGSAGQWMERLGIRHLAGAYPAELSGGELRRMAVARALAGDPAVILADEPTGDLDDENTSLVLSALRQAADQGKAVFLVTHESAALPFADRAFRMDAGEMTAMEAQRE